MDKKDESFENLVIAIIGAPAVFFYGVPVSAVHGLVSAEIVDWMFDKITFQS